jgi:hypothetical protein
MFFAFVVLGLLAIVTSVRGNQAAVATQLQQDFTAQSSGPSFWVWIGAILVFGLIGRITGATGAMRLFVILLIVVYLVSNNGIFAKFSAALQPPAPAPTSTTEAGAAVDASSTSTSSATSPQTASAVAGNATPPSNVPAFVAAFQQSPFLGGQPPITGAH